MSAAMSGAFRWPPSKRRGWHFIGIVKEQDMAASADILLAIRELTSSKQIDRSELHGLLTDGINAALAKKHGPNVQAEVSIDEANGAIRIVLLKDVVAEVTDS